ncbi:unnamed protein product [Absidia cylindrospora]
MDEEDPFLISKTRGNESQLDKLQSRLSNLKKTKQDLKNKLAQEKLSYLMTTSFANAIPDPRKQKAIDMVQVQEKIMNQLTTAIESNAFKKN